MEAQIKKAIKSGNSSAVILPRSWLNKDVRIELVKKTDEMILLDIINIIKKEIDLENVIGIYLVGSYARGEEDEKSDIDILVITDNIDKEMISEGIYNILIVSLGLLKHKLNYDLFPLGQMIKEAKPLLNSDYLRQIELKVTKTNVKWYLDTTVDKLKIIQEIIYKMKNKNKKYANDRIAYTLILRIRTLCIIQKLIENKNYSKREFIRLIHRISKGNNSYERYLSVKNNLKEENRTSLDEIESLYKYLKNYLEDVRQLVRNL